MRTPSIGDSVSCGFLGVGILQGGWDGHYDVELVGYGSVRVTNLSGSEDGYWVGVLSDQSLVGTNWTKERQAIFERITALLKEFRFSDADDLYRTSCREWLDEHIYLRLRSAEETVFGFSNIYRSGSLAQLDSYFLSSIMGDFSVEELVELKLPRVRNVLSGLGMTLDAEQLRANARPEKRLQIKARAGSGKTRTLSARAALAIHDESLDPNQVLILAFNKAAANEVKHRVQKMLMGAAYENARTFHSLAYQLVKPRRKLLFDAGGSPSAKEQSRFAQRMMQRIVNPAFKEEMVDFFRKELEQIESIGRDLPPSDYYIFRRSLEHVTLGGQWIRETGEKIFTNGERVKSNGEKFIADFFFEHDIKYRYERAWMWKTSFLDGSTYKPDFSIIANGKDYILEHWAIDPEDPEASLPVEWCLTARQYSKQIQDKRQFWKSKSIQLLETHTGMMNAGRESFEHQLTLILEGAGIRCCRLSNQEIIDRVFQNDFLISRMAGLFLQFIQRAKKRGWSVNAVANVIESTPDREPRARSFHQLALRAYREYELMLSEEDAMDFDDLLVQAAETVGAVGGGASIHLGDGKMIPIGDLKWILLDEYQDFSELYFRMLSQILTANPEIRLVAVGDDWQAINAFAGAELSFFKRFSDYFPDSTIVGVTTNYRSDRHVVSAGNSLMQGRGEPARICHSAGVGEIRVVPLSSVWVQFMRSAGREDDWKADQVYLPPGTDGKASEAVLRQAQAFKSCVEILRPALEADAVAETLKMTEGRPFAMLLSRTNFAYGLSLDEFRARVIDILEVVTQTSRSLLDRTIDAITAHGSKGREAHTVIILDATERQFPKVHPDNLLFQVFGLTAADVLEEERRLFYVAITRAERRLFLLTDKGAESPYLKLLQVPVRSVQGKYDLRPTEHIVLSPLALRIKEWIDKLDCDAIDQSCPQVTGSNLWDLVRINVVSSFRPLVDQIRKANLPCPESEFFLGDYEEELFADISWPNASPPIAILAGGQSAYRDVWVERGWRVFDSTVTVAQLRENLRF